MKVKCPNSDAPFSLTFDESTTVANDTIVILYMRALNPEGQFLNSCNVTFPVDQFVESIGLHSSVFDTVKSSCL